MRHFLLLGLVLGLGGTSAIAAQGRPQIVWKGEESTSSITGLSWPRLKRGARGEQVRTLQILLKFKGFRVVPDGYFGPATIAVVRSFQKQKRLKIDGIVGWQTWEKIAPHLVRGARGEPVRRLQFLLTQFDNSHPIEIDGFYGAQTEKAVGKINIGMHVNPETPPGKEDGEANVFVWCVLLGGYYNA